MRRAWSILLQILQVACFVIGLWLACTGGVPAQEGPRVVGEYENEELTAVLTMLSHGGCPVGAHLVLGQLKNGGGHFQGCWMRDRTHVFLVFADGTPVVLPLKKFGIREL